MRPLFTWHIISCLIIFFLTSTLKGFCQSPVILTETKLVENYIGHHAAFFVEESDSMSIEQARKHLFTPLSEDVPNFQISNKAVWLRIVLINHSPSANPMLQVAHPTIDELHFYTFRGDSLIKESELGEDRPYKDRTFDYQDYLYYTGARSGDTVEIYFRALSKEELILPINIGGPSEMIGAMSMQDLFMGLYVGAILLMAIYNFFLFFSIRDSTYALYTFYILCTCLTQVMLSGYAFRFLWPNAYWLNDPMSVLVPFLNGIMALLFVRRFLNLPSVSRKLNNGLKAAMLLYFVPLIFAYFSLYTQALAIMQITAFVGSMYVLYLSINLTLKGNQLAARLLLAWIMFLIGIMTFVLRNFGILPYNLFTIYSIQIGSLLEVALLSFALGDKINNYRREKEDSQVQILRITEENARIIREHNMLLEQEVDRQTHNLRAANENLNNSLLELQQAQSQLIASEKLASLGMLIAGIAHEINNPVNFVTSSALPLRGDFEQFLGIVRNMESIALSGSHPEEIKRQLDELKGSEDYDYLITEVDALISSIEEGARRTAEIIKSLLIFSRGDEDSLRVANINEGIESTLIVLKSVFSDCISLHKKLSVDLPPVECYPGKLNQALLNIITNAVHAIEAKFGRHPGGILEIETSHDEGTLSISIKDNGSGISEDVRAKMFDPFFTTKDVGQGTGLGLSIVYQTIQKHKGIIQVDSQVGEGTEFIITIPLVQLVRKNI